MIKIIKSADRFKSQNTRLFSSFISIWSRLIEIILSGKRKMCSSSDVSFLWS